MRLSLSVSLSLADYVYRRHDLINIGLKCILSVTTQFHDSHNIPPDIARALGSPWLVVGLCKWRRQRRERKQKRGCRSGILVRLRPGQVCCQEARFGAAKGPAHNSDLISDAAVQLDGHSLHRCNRNRDSSKSRGGVLWIFMYESGCTNSRTTDCHCFADLEFLSQLFTSFPNANVSIVLSLLLANVNRQQRTYPDGAHILASDFNHACLKSVLLNFVQHVSCASRARNTLDCAYSNIKHAYSGVPLPHFGDSHHLSLLMLPAYVPVRRQQRQPGGQLRPSRKMH